MYKGLMTSDVYLIIRKKFLFFKGNCPMNYVSPVQGLETYCFSPSVCLSQIVSAL